MRRLFLTLLFAVGPWIFGAAIPFPHESSDLKLDPAARFGTLPNGLRYVIRPNQEPKQRASLRLLVEAGAVHEKDDQLGLAHFLEHMAFNGSEHYAPNTLIEFFQRMGMNFGGDTNASTWFTRTLYLLELPDTKAATLNEGFKVFADYAGGLLLKAEEIDKERGIILSEKRTRDSVGYRTSMATNNFLLAGTMFAKRDVIGTTEVLSTAQRNRFVDYYDTWYRPELMSIVVVGDIDAEAIEKQVKTLFSAIKARSPTPVQPDLGKVQEPRGVRVFHHSEPEAPTTNVTLATVVPYSHETDNAANRLKYLPRMLAHAMLNRRLSILAKKENAPFTNGNAGAGEGYNFYRQTMVSLTCRQDQWEDALAVADQELRRALEHGFQPAELKEIVANYINSFEQGVKTAATRRSDGLADEITDTLLDRNVFTTPQDDLALYKPALEKVTVADCVAALRSAWNPPHRLIMVTGNAKIAAGTGSTDAKTKSSPAAESAIAAAYQRSLAVAVTAPETIADAQWAYTDFGPAGKVAKREHVADLDITLITFANGVRLNLKPTNFEANRIRVNVRVGTGQLTQPLDQPGLSFYTGQTFTGGGLRQHSLDDLRRIFAGKTVGANFSAGSDAFILAGATNKDDLLLQLQLITAHVTEPGYRPEAARQARKSIDQIYLGFEHTASGPFNREVARLLVSGDSRFGFPAKDEMLQRNSEEVKAWLDPQLGRGAIEVAMVGDLDLDATIAAVAKTLGALPNREPRPELASARKVVFPAEPFSRELTIVTEIPKGNVVVYWPTTDGRDIQRARRLNLLSDIFTDRMRIKIREELGDTYGYSASSSASDVYPGYGYIAANVTVDPPKAKQLADLIVTLSQVLAEKGVTQDELDRARQPLLTSLRESSRDNGYWLGSVLSRAQERPQMLDWCRSRYSDHEAMTEAELDALAKSYLGAAHASRVIIVPAAR